MVLESSCFFVPRFLLTSCFRLKVVASQRMPAEEDNCYLKGMWVASLKCVGASPPLVATSLHPYQCLCNLGDVELLLVCDTYH